MNHRTNWFGRRLRPLVLRTLVAVVVLNGFAAHRANAAPSEEIIEKFGNYHAIVIGIDEYAAESWWPALRYAEQDARDIKKILSESYGFKVTPIYGAEATRSKILKTIRSKITALDENDNLLIFYAGHGMTNPITEEGFWIPVDAADAIDEESWISFSKVRTLVKAKRADVKRIALITDSCYGGTLTEQRGTQGGLLNPDDDPESYQSWLLKSADVRSRLIISSGGLEEEVPDQSEFTDLLKMTLEENTLDMIDLYHIFSRILSYSYFQNQEQTPMIETILSDRKGHPAQFVLIRRQ